MVINEEKGLIDVMNDSDVFDIKSIDYHRTLYYSNY